MSDERGGRYFREARFFLGGDKVAAQSHILEARSLLGYLRDQLALGGPPIAVKYATLSDGTLIKATMANGHYQAEIVAPARASGGEQVTYEVYVRPEWGAVYDWLVTKDPSVSHSVVTTRTDPVKYSNRMWQAGDGSLLAVIGGNDSSRYFGVGGDTIALDGVVVLTGGANIVGAATYKGKLVYVTVASAYAGGVETAQYTVHIGATYTYTTPVISADPLGYLTPAGDKRLSQQTVIFNSDCTEGACVLGDYTVLKFAITSDTYGAPVCTHTIATIPGTNPTVTPAGTASGYQSVSDVFSGYTRTTMYSNHYTLTSGDSYTTAFACDYIVVGGVDTLVYGLLVFTDGKQYTEATDQTEVRTWSECVSGNPPATYTPSGTSTVTTFGSDSLGVYPGIDVQVTSTLHGSLCHLLQGVGSYQVFTPSGGSLQSSATRVFTSYTLGVIHSLDLRYGYIARVATVPSIVDVSTSTAWDSTNTIGTPTTTTTTTTYSVPNETYMSSFIGGVPVQHNIPTTPSTAVTVAVDGNISGGFSYCGPAVTSSSYTNTPVTAPDPSPPVATITIPRPTLFAHDVVPTIPPEHYSYGFMYPTGGGLGDWVQALTFFTPPSNPAIVYSMFSAGNADVSSKFVDGVNPVAGRTTTKHFGVIRRKRQI